MVLFVPMFVLVHISANNLHVVGKTWKICTLDNEVCGAFLLFLFLSRIDLVLSMWAVISEKECQRSLVLFTLYLEKVWYVLGCETSPFILCSGWGIKSNKPNPVDFRKQHHSSKSLWQLTQHQSWWSWIGHLLAHSCLFQPPRPQSQIGLLSLSTINQFNLSTMFYEFE